MKVKPSEIASALVQIWKSPESANKTRANLFNLIFYVEENARMEYIRAIAQKMVEKYPSRIFFILANKSAKESAISCEVSLLSAGEVACDLIEIDVSGEMRTRVPLLILPHILPDLPVFFIWAEKLATADPLFVQLSKFATRLIFDSECTESLPKFAQDLLTLHAHAACSDVADLNWARTENWRDALSTTFYPPQKFADLKETTEVTLTFNAASTAFFCHTNIQALYLQTWLASRLGWKLKGSQKSLNSLIFTYAREGGEVKVSLSSTQEARLAPGIVFSLDLSTKNGTHYVFSRDLNKPHQITLTYSTRELCEMPTYFLFAKGEKGQSLVKEISHKGTSAHYLDVLERVSKLDTKNLC